MDIDNILTMVGSLPPIVSAVLKHVPARQLNSCSQVNRLWYRTAQTVKKHRKSLNWFFFVKENGNCEALFLEHMANMSSEPKFVLMFCTKSMVLQPEKFFSSRSLKRKQCDTQSATYNLCRPSFKNPVIGHMIHSFPLDCDVGFCTSSGVTGTFTDNSQTLEFEKSPALGIICFPKIPGVDIYRFQMSGIEYSADFNVDEHTGIPPDKPVKCLLVFLHDKIYSHRGICSNTIIHHFVQKQRLQIAIGGAYVNHMYFPKHKPRRRHQSYAVAFTGENVEAASIIIGPQIETKEKIEKELQVFSTMDLMKNRCIAFMFTCVARGTSLFGVRNMESSVFRQLYPNVPLFGVFGNGEIGIDYWPGRVNKSKDQSSWYHSYCTVFVMLSIKE